MQIYLLYPVCLLLLPIKIFPGPPPTETRRRVSSLFRYARPPPPMPRIRKREKNKSYSSFLFSPAPNFLVSSFYESHVWYT